MNHRKYELLRAIYEATYALEMVCEELDLKSYRKAHKRLHRLLNEYQDEVESCFLPWYYKQVLLGNAERDVTDGTRR